MGLSVVKFSALAIIVCYFLTTLQGSYDCDGCYCEPEDQVLLCAGRSVIRFPQLEYFEREKVRSIYVLNTLIGVLPDVEDQLFPTLGYVMERNNTDLDCSEIDKWLCYLGENITVVSDCHGPFCFNETTTSSPLTTNSVPTTSSSAGTGTSIDTAGTSSTSVTAGTTSSTSLV